jgi:hypothetical protein
MIYLINSVVRVCSLRSIFQIGIGLAEDAKMQLLKIAFNFEEWSIRVYGDVFWID